VRSDVGALRDERSSEYVFFPPTALALPPPLSDAGTRAAEKVVRIATTLIPARGGPLFSAWCIADTDLAMMLWRLSRTGYPLPDKVRNFADAEWERPSVREFVGKPRPSTFVAY
jgi:glutathione S-transferase